MEMKVITKSHEDLLSYIAAEYPILFLISQDETETDGLIREVRSDQKIIEWNMAKGFVNFESKQSMLEWCDLPEALDYLLRHDELTNHLVVIRDAHFGLRDKPLAVARLKALVMHILEKRLKTTIFLVSSQQHIPIELEKFITIVEIGLPSEFDIRNIILEVAEEESHNGEVTVDDSDLNKLAKAYQGLTRYEIKQLVRRGYQRDGLIGLEDLELIQNEKKQIIKKSGILEMLTVTETLDQIGGLEKLKPWLNQKSAILNDWDQAELFNVEPPKGVMIVGMPGCGKSLTAKATAALFKLPLLKMDMGSLMGKYVGESEGNMRRAIQVAEAVSPCVLWVDEVEKAFVGVGSGGSGSEVTTRLFGYFLTWMQEKTKQVFVIATANDISCLPPELLRKGRFDEIFYVDFPNESERAAIFEVHLKKRKKLTKNVNISQLAKLTAGYSGADIEAVIKEGIEQAFVNRKSPLDTDRLASVIKATQPLSVVMKDKVEKFKNQFDKMKIKAAS
jgi:ATP-dependent 26S proteasome regulatory subunit